MVGAVGACVMPRRAWVWIDEAAQSRSRDVDDAAGSARDRSDSSSPRIATSGKEIHRLPVPPTTAVPDEVVGRGLRGGEDDEPDRANDETSHGAAL